MFRLPWTAWLPMTVLYTFQYVFIMIPMTAPAELNPSGDVDFSYRDTNFVKHVWYLIYRDFMIAVIYRDLWMISLSVVCFFLLRMTIFDIDFRSCFLAKCLGCIMKASSNHLPVSPKILNIFLRFPLWQYRQLKPVTSYSYEWGGHAINGLFVYFHWLIPGKEP